MSFIQIKFAILDNIPILVGRKKMKLIFISTDERSSKVWK